MRRGAIAAIARARCDTWPLGPTPASANVCPISGQKNSGS